VFPVKQFISALPTLEGTVLDIGGGAGLQAEYLLSSNPQIEKYIILDSSKRKIQMAQERLARFSKRTAFLVADAIKSDFNSKFDSIVLCDFLHHISRTQKTQLLDLCKTNLKQGGQLIIKDLDNKPRFGYYLNFLHDVIATGSTKLDFPAFEYYKEYCEELGFQNIMVRPLKSFLPYNHRLLIGTK